MKTIKLKHPFLSEGHLTAAHPGAEPGSYKSGAIVLAVTGLPDDASIRDAIAILDSVMLPGWIYTVDASQAGKNLWRPSNCTEAQLAASPDWFRSKELHRAS